MERPANSDELPVYLAYLIDALQKRKDADWFGSMSDDFYHSNGRYAAAQREIRWLQKEIEETQRLLSLVN